MRRLQHFELRSKANETRAIFRRTDIRTRTEKAPYVFGTQKCVSNESDKQCSAASVTSTAEKTAKKLLQNAEGREDKRGFPSNSLGVLNWDKQRLLRRQKPLLHIPSGRLQIQRFIAHEQHLLFLYCQFITGSRGCDGLEKR